ncbi:MAG: hypothetical protein ACHQ51_01410 [Elusimicrobiota bacterium]
MKRVALAFACLLSAVLASAAPSPDLHKRTVRLMREIRLESLNPVKNAAPLRARLAALRKENLAAPDAEISGHLRQAAENLDRLESGRPLLPPDREEAAGESAPAEPPPLPVQPRAELLRDAVAAVPPAAGAAYFDLSAKRADSAPVSAGKPASRPASASLEKYLSLTGDEERHAHLRMVTADLFARMARKDPGSKGSIILARRLHEHLSKHPRKGQFASLNLSATSDGHLHLIYRLKSGSLTDEDLGLLDEWSAEKDVAVKPGKPGKGGGRASRGGGGGAKKGGKKGAKGGDGDDGGDGGGSSKGKSKGGGGGSKRRGGGKKGGGSGDGGGDGSASSGGGGGKGARVPKKRGGAAMFDGATGGDDAPGGRSGRGGRASKRGGSGAERGAARIKSGRRLSSGEGEGSGPSSKKSDRRVPLPKGFPVRHDRLEGGSGGAKAGKGAKGGGGEAGGDFGGKTGGKSKGAYGKNPDKAPSPDKAMRAGGSAPEPMPAVAGRAAAPRAESGSADSPLRVPVVGNDDDLHDAVAAHSAQAAPAVASSAMNMGGGAPVPVPPSEDDPWTAGALALAGAASGLGALALKRKSLERPAARSREESV